MTLFGIACTPRSARTEVQEVDFLDKYLGRRTELIYSMRPALSPDWDSSPMNHNRLSMYAPKINPKQILDGSALPQIVNFLESVPKNGKIHRWVHWQEPGDDIKNGSFTLDEYINSFTILYDVFSSRSDILLGQNISSWDFDPGNVSAIGAKLVHPRAAFCGISLFANVPDPNGMRNSLGLAVRAIEEKTLPALSSVGFAVNQSTAGVKSWGYYLATFSLAHELDHIVAYSSDVGDATWAYKPWWIDGNSTVGQAWRELSDFT